MSAEDAFMSWLATQEGVAISAAIKLHDFSSSGQGRGIIAVEPIHNGDILFEIPLGLVLSTANSSLSGSLPELVQDFEDNAWAQLILTLMYEHGQARQNASRWGPYLDVLPRSFTTPMWYSDEELQELQGCSMLKRIGKEDANALYRDKIKPFLERHASHFDMSVCGLEDFHRWGSCIMSYAFDLGDQDDLSAVEDPLDSDAEDDLSEKVLCPLADMLNADNRLCNAKLVMSGGSLIMAAYEEIAPGEQIYNTYGVLPSADLLRRYGYVEQGENLVDTAEIGGDLIAKEVAVVQGDALEKRIDYLLQQELDDEFEIPVNGKLPSEMIAFTEMLMLSDKSFALLVEGNGLTTGSKTPAMQPAMLRILRARLAMFATTVAEDEAILQRGELSSNMRNIVRVRLSEKRILQKAVGLVEEWTFKRSQVDEREANAKRRKA